MSPAPVFGICGYSGSGKTTLIETLLPSLASRGLRIVVIKHDCHGLSADREGKDSYRLFKAGADIVAQGPDEIFVRHHGASDLAAILRTVESRYDAVLVEGHKRSPLARKIWLLTDGEQAPPAETGTVDLVLSRQADRHAAALDWIGRHIAGAWTATPVHAGILIGGQSTRMGRPKHLLTRNGRTWIEHIAEIVRPFVTQTVLLGTAEIPQSLSGLAILPDVPGIAGPLAGMLAAMRWNPGVSWLFAACDMPLISAPAIEWLLAGRRPGVWATLPRLGNESPAEPLFAHYDFRARHLLEACGQPIEIVKYPQIERPFIPSALSAAWRNLNTPKDIS